MSHVPSAFPATVDATLDLLTAHDYVAERRLATAVSSRSSWRGRCSSKARRVWARRRSPRCSPRASRVRSFACSATRASTRRRRLRVELSAADDRDPAGGGRGRRRPRRAVARHLHAPLPAQAAAAAGDRSRRRRGAGPADRRTGPHRRAVRSVPARSAVGLPGVDSRAGRDRGQDAAHRRHHVESHARNPRCDQAPLPLSLGRLSGRAARTRDPAPQVSARAARSWRAKSSPSRSGCARWTSSRRRALPKRWTGPRRCWRSTASRSTRRRSADTLGVLLKYQDDVGAITQEVAERLVAEVQAEGIAL